MAIDLAAASGERVGEARAVRTSQLMSDADLIVKHLLADHARIDASLQRLADAAAANASADLQKTWGELERCLLPHLDEEESFLFPTLEHERPAEAAALAADHARFRKLFGEIGIGIELHNVRASTIDALARDLREHAAHEDTVLYRWAASSGAPGPRAFIARLRRRLGLASVTAAAP